MTSHWKQLVIVIMTIALVLAACATPPPQATSEPAVATEAPAATEPPAAQAPAETPPPGEAPAATAPAEAPDAGGDYADAPREETVIFDIYGTVETPDLWNPFMPGVYSIHGLRQAMMEPLFNLNYSTGQIDGWLAESFAFNDTMDVWTIKLRQGAAWSDGQPLTADDLLFTVDMIRKTEGLLYNAELNTWVKDIKKIDDQTVEITLTEPNPRFLLDFFTVKISAALSPVPKHIWEGQDPVTFKNYDPAQGWPVFSGPYTLASTSANDFIYVRNDDWWGAKTGFQPLPAPKKLVWTTSANEEIKVSRMANNEVDALHDISLGALQTLQANNPKVIVWHDGPPYSWADPCTRSLNLNNAAEPWNDKDMRWMLNYVINRDQIIDIAYEQTSTKAAGVFPDYKPLKAYMDKLPPELIEKVWTTDTAKAAEILTSKGYTKSGDYWQKDGKNLSIDIGSIQGDSESIRAVDLIVEQLQAFGIDAANRVTDANTYYNSIDMGNYQAGFADYTCGSVNEPWSSLNTIAGKSIAPVGERATGAQGNGNVFRYSSAEYTDLVDQMGALPLGDPKIDELFVNAMTIFYDDLPIIPLSQAKKLLPFNTTYWTNWPTAENDYVVPAHWWQSTFYMLVNLKPATP